MPITLALGEADWYGMVWWKYEPYHHVVARNECCEGEDRNKTYFSKAHSYMLSYLFLSINKLINGLIYWHVLHCQDPTITQ